MKEAFRHFYKPQHLTILVAVIALSALVFVLLSMNYISQRRLEKSAVETIKHNLERRVAIINYFFSERINDINDLKTNRAIAIFFENEALEMSMEYGLRTSLAEMNRCFDNLIERRAIDGNCVYTAIAFIKPGGKILTQSSIAAPDTPFEADLRKYLNSKEPEARVLINFETPCSTIDISAAYFFKGRYVGQIVARISPYVFWQQVQVASLSAHSSTCLIGERLFTPPDIYSFSKDQKMLCSKAAAFRREGDPNYFNATFQDGKTRKMLALNAPILKAPLNLTDIVRVEDVLGSTAPWHTILIAGAFSLLIMVGVVLMLRVNVRNLVLNTRLEEITKREQEINAQNQVLEKEIAARILVEKELKKAKEIAESANRAKSEFLANMSHELRTPLNHIMGFTELVVDRRCGDLTPIQAEYLNDVLDSSHHLLSLINDILDLSKVESGRWEVEPSEVDIKTLLKNGLNMVREKAMKNLISFEEKLTEIPASIHADERKLKQIIYNILSNAVKFTPQGGKVSIAAINTNISEIPVKTKDGRDIAIPPAKERATQFIWVSVSDTGIGMQQEALDRVFEKFFQVEGAYSRKFKGTGLGLALTKNLVTLHGGSVWAESDGEGKGSTFHFIIPTKQ